jgi:hypothetical protein
MAFASLYLINKVVRKKGKGEFLPIGIAPPRAVVFIIPPGIIGIRVGRVVIFSPEVKLFALKKRVWIFQFAMAHYFSSKGFPCDGDSPSSLEDIRVRVPLNEDNESPFGTLKFRPFHPIQRALQWEYSLRKEGGQKPNNTGLTEIDEVFFIFLPPFNPRIQTTLNQLLFRN